MVQITVGEPLGEGAGRISAKDFGEQEAQALGQQVANEYLVTVAPNAPGCCIDGRPCLYTLAGKSVATQPGPSVAGGPTITAYAAAELVGDYFTSMSAAGTGGKIAEINEILVSGGITLGGHVSEGAVSAHFVKADTNEPQTGCGANDQFVAIIRALEQYPDFVASTLQALLGENYDPAAARFVSGELLQQRLAAYNPRTVIDTVAAAAAQAASNVEVLEGGHAEVLVVFNYVDATTVDRDQLVADTGKQVFVVDMWYIDALAKSLAAGRPDALQMFARLRHAMVAFQVATYLGLCDGTHRPVIVRPEPTAVPANL